MIYAFLVPNNQKAFIISHQQVFFFLEYNGRGGVSQMLTKADEGGRGVKQMLTIADEGGSENLRSWLT